MEFPVIAKEEFVARWKHVQEILMEQNVDVLFVYADDHFTYGAAYGRYYANFPAAFEPVLIMFTPNHEPVLLTGPESDGYAACVGEIQDIRVLKEFAHEDEDYLFSNHIALKDVLAEFSCAQPRRVGLGGASLMSHQLYSAIERAVSGAQLVDLDESLSMARGVKSPAELDIIRYAYQIACAGMRAAIDAIRPGVTERQVAAAAEYAMRCMGSDGTGIDTIVASGDNAKHILARATNREIQANDVIVVTVAPRYEGYHGAIGRTIILGTPDPEFLKLLQAQETAQKVCSSQIRAGVMGSEIEAMGRRIMTDAGYEKNFLYSGIHSIGVIEFEPPILGPSSTTVLQKDMVISIDIPSFETDIGGCRTEDGYIVTESSFEPLTNEIPRIILK